MKVLVQYPSWSAKPCGVWWAEDGVLKDFYVTDTPARLLASAYLSQKRDDVSWEDIFTQMANRMPRNVSYEVMDTDSPVRLITELQK